MLCKKTGYIISAIFFVTASIFSKGFHHFDEHFQILEFAGAKLGLCSFDSLSWEYQSRIRPTIQPFIVFYVYKFCILFGIKNPFFLATLLRFLSSILAFTSITLLYRAGVQSLKIAKLQTKFFIVSFFCWYLVYIGVRFSSENWAGAIFAISFSLYFLMKKESSLNNYIIGILLGFSFLFRYQIGFMILGFLLWLAFIKRTGIKKMRTILLGILTILVLGILIDYWFYSEWVITTWNYLWQYLEHDVIQGKTSIFGHEPWWWYFYKFIVQGVPPISLIFLFSFLFLLVYDSKSPIIWSVLPFLLVHILIGHKELRFLFPAVYFLPLMFISSVECLNIRHQIKFDKKSILNKVFLLAFSINIILLIIVSLKPAENNISLYKSIYSNYKEDTTLYYMKDNPYHRVLNVNFYKRENLIYKKINSLNEININSDVNSLLVLKSSEQPNNNKLQFSYVYSTFTNWISAFNFNNWLERTNNWRVYEVSQKKNIN